MANPTIKMGATGAAVKKAQRELICRYDLPSDSDDGIFGPLTRNGVLRYQLTRAVDGYAAYSFALDVDGVVGPQTWFRLSPELVKDGARGDRVTFLQEILTDYGFTPGPVDGVFGPQTENAVTSMQDLFGVDVDGVVGPKTWCALYS